MSDQKTITIDNNVYDLDSLSDAAKQQLVNFRVADGEIARLQTQLALAQTARNAYGQALKVELEKAEG
jgi:hypothetical protein